MATPAKKPKLNKKAKNFFAKQGQKKNFLKIGDHGYLVTYNFKEKESVREIYKLLNEYYQQQHQQIKGAGFDKNLKPEEVSALNDIEKEEYDDEDDDIVEELSTEINKAKQETQDKSNLFQAVETGTNNCVFIKTSMKDYHSLGLNIIRDLFDTKIKKTRFSNRFIPVDRVCRANIDDIVNSSGELFDLHFLKEASTFAINFNRRCNNDIQRDDVIKQLAALVTQKNIKNKVDLKNPQKTILIEIIKGLCLISIIPDYLKLRKYNLNELCISNNKKQESNSNNLKIECTEKGENASNIKLECCN